MSDNRSCDGPGCTYVANLQVEHAVMSKPSAEDYITLVRGGGRPDLHFHEQTCLTNWTNKNTNGRGSSAN